ncbi:DUF4913 domain-containing protein [Nocardia rhamnosiphila]
MTSPNPQNTDDTEEVPDVYNDAGEWFDHWLLPLLEGKWIGGGKGKVICPEWWQHRMVSVRIHALWREWEKANREETMSSWWVYHYDAHSRALFDAENGGPMFSCTKDKHRETPKLKLLPVPPGWFDQDSAGPDFSALAL